MAIVNGIMVPHPPLILPQVGRGEEEGIRNTINAYREAGRFIAQAEPELIIVATPHSVMYADWFHISPGAKASGSFAQFRAPQVRISADYDTAFVKELCRMAREAGFPAGTDGERSPALDHATMIPLYFLQEAYQDTPLPPIVRIGLAGLPLTEHYRLGRLLQNAATALHRRTSVIASGDLSHKLKADGPYGLSKEGPLYDARIMDVMGRGAFNELFDFSEVFCEQAGECGHRCFTILAGCFDGQAVKAKALSYEGPFGVGYGVCQFSSAGDDEARRFLDRELMREAQALQDSKAKEDEYVRLARLSVETYVTTGRHAALPANVSEELTARRAGVFTTLHKHGQLRGCIGTTAPTTANIAREILQNGVSACSQDPRFPPVTKEELPYLTYSVDVLGEAEDVDSPAQLDVKRYGVIVSCGRRRGLLLPDLDGVDSVEEQIRIARRKGGIDPEEAVRLQRFEVIRHV